MSTKPNKEQILELITEQRDHLSQEFGVSSLGLFGSFAKDQAHANSDVDLVVEFSRPIGLRFIELADYLENLLGRKVDILTPEGIRDIRQPAIANSIIESIIHV